MLCFMELLSREFCAIYHVVDHVEASACLAAPATPDVEDAAVVAALAARHSVVATRL